MPCKNHPLVTENISNCSRCGNPFCGDCVIPLKGSIFCIDCKAEELKDLQSGVDSSKLDMASIGKRFGAVFIDGFMCNIVSQVFAVAINAAIGPGLLQFFVSLSFSLTIYTLYEGFMLQSRGQTVGKIAMKIKVVTPDGHDITPKQAWGRALFRTASNFVLGIGPMIDDLFALGVEKTALHDRVAQTRVINWQ